MKHKQSTHTKKKKVKKVEIKINKKSLSSFFFSEITTLQGGKDDDLSLSEPKVKARQMRLPASGVPLCWF
jgi:hypothetical protein